MTDVPPADAGGLLRFADVVTIAVWTAAVFGLAEGVLLDASRAWPRVLAPYKASAHLIWIAPAVDIVMFIALAGVLRLAAPFSGRLRTRHAMVCWTVFVFCGVATVVLALNVIHVLSAILLAAGVSVASTRWLTNREPRLRRALRRRVWTVPVALALMAVSVWSWEAWAEHRRYSRLPPVVHGQTR